MDIKTYILESSRTCADLGSPDLNNIHMMLGMCTEIAELQDVFKKNLAYKKEIDITNVREEIGDLMWYVGNFCRMNNFDLEEILDTNIEKLKVRYPEKFTHENAINRDLKKEREILEK